MTHFMLLDATKVNLDCKTYPYDHLGRVMRSDYSTENYSVEEDQRGYERILVRRDSKGLPPPRDGGWLSGLWLERHGEGMYKTYY